VVAVVEVLGVALRIVRERHRGAPRLRRAFPPQPPDQLPHRRRGPPRHFAAAKLCASFPPAAGAVQDQQGRRHPFSHTVALKTEAEAVGSSSKTDCESSQLKL
jgi:hypothetical protein